MSANDRRSRRRPHTASTNWDGVATWYDGWVGQRGSVYHRQLAIPAALRLLELARDEEILDLGCGQGVLAPYVTATGARYTGVDAASRLIGMARDRHGEHGRFLVGDARSLSSIPGLRRASFDAAIFLLSIQDMDPLQHLAASLDWALRAKSRVVLLMTHPAFRQPRHSGWGEDRSRGLTFRRIDSYLSPMAVPMKSLGRRPPTRSFHRPISAYVNELAAFGFATDAMDEIAETREVRQRSRQSGTNRAQLEIPLFLGLRARRS